MYEQLKLQYVDFIADLKSMGIEEEQIEQILCETYGLCK